MKFKAAEFLTVTRAVGFSYTRRFERYDDAQTCPDMPDQNVQCRRCDAGFEEWEWKITLHLLLQYMASNL